MNPIKQLIILAVSLAAFSACVKQPEATSAAAAELSSYEKCMKEAGSLNPSPCQWVDQEFTFTPALPKCESQDPTHVPATGKLTIVYLNSGAGVHKFKVKVTDVDTAPNGKWPPELRNATFIYNPHGEQYSSYISPPICPPVPAEAAAGVTPTAEPTADAMNKSSIFDKLYHFAAKNVKLHAKADHTGHEEHNLVLVPIDCADEANKEHCSSKDDRHIMFAIPTSGPQHNGVSHGDN